MGKKMPDIKTAGGEIFTNVEIKSVDHTGVRISHSGGSKTIKPEDLPADLYDRFQFDLAKKEAMEKKEDEVFKDHANNVEIANLAQSGTDKLRQITNLNEEVKKATEDIQNAKDGLNRYQTAIDRKRMDIASEKAKKGGISKAPQMMEELKIIERNAKANRESIPQNEQKVTRARREIAKLNEEVREIKSKIEEIKKAQAAGRAGTGSEELNYMLTEDSDQSGTVGLLVGIIVLVFAGICFSLMADKRFKFSRGKADMEAEIAQDSLGLEALRRQTEVSRDEYERKSQRANQPALLDKARREVSTTADRIRELRSQQTDLKRAVEDEKAAFAAYRASFRKGVRQAAVGEQMDRLEVVSGKVYQSVTIRRVNADGMEVSHSQGSLRLGPDDLADSWRQRFQWGPDELAVAPKPVKAAEKQVPGRQEPVKQDKDKPALSAKQDKQLSNLRRDVTEAKRRLERSELEVSRVRKEASDSDVKKVPGSAETWDEKIERLESGIKVFRGQYMEARGRLAAESPDDAALSEKTSPAQ